MILKDQIIYQEEITSQCLVEYPNQKLTCFGKSIPFFISPKGVILNLQWFKNLKLNI
jgi:hypothetical protein